jgi:hypothetical protein
MSVKFTKTATFLFPLLEVPKTFFDCNIKDRFGRPQYHTRFLNAYLEDSTITKYKSDGSVDYIFVVLRNYQDVDFDKFYTTLQAFPNYVDDYDTNDCLIVVFRVPDTQQMNFDILKNGYYSRVTPEGQKLILANNFYSGKVFTLPLIFSKALNLKESWEERLSNPNSVVDLGEQEVWSIINYQDEVLDEEILNSLTKKKVLTPMGEF